RRRKMKVVNSHTGALSFAFMIVDGFLPDDINLGRRELLVIDENDGLEGWLVEFGSFRIRCDYVRDLNELKDWCKDEIKRLVDKRNELLRDGSEEAMKKAEKIGKRIWKLNTFMECDEDNYVMEWKDGVAKVVPIDIRELAEKLIYWRADKRLLMSATNLNLKDTCLCNGLDRKRTAFIEAKHPFRKENRVVVYRPVAKMTKDERYKNFDRMAEEVERIVNEHSGEKGIIHCHSYEIANEIHKRLDGLCDIHSSDDRNEAIRRFVEGEIEVLVAVGFERGIDLKGDICRWQIICKVPYPDMSDLRVRELLVNRGMWNWFRGQAIKNLIQACGRGVRDFDDWCVTYVLDESFGNLIRYKRMFPKWFLEAVVYEERRQNLV
ncbi:MAG: helicase C-terminal domain-containing protein, partial [Candidatus Thorarchaeota archaeon]